MRTGSDAPCGEIQGAPLRAELVLLLPGLAVRFAIVGLSAFLLLLASTPASASSLLAGAAGAADAGLGGATIAEPRSPLGAQFTNPAGLAGFTESSMGLSVGLAYGRGEVTADVPAGYHAENEVLVPFLDDFLVIARENWTFGISLMGTSGARYDYGARPALGVDDGFFSESAILAAPIGAAYRISDQLWIGAEIIALYGSSHLRYSREVAEAPGTPTRFRFTAGGFGVQSMVGITWKPDDNWSLGASVKPPGRIWADGDSPYGAGKQDVDLEIEAPMEIALGVTRSIATNWRASYGFRFSDTSVLAKSFFRFEKTPSADQPFLSGARDEWRHALGLEYAWSESLHLRGGVSKANGIISSKGTTPASYDSSDWRLYTGLGWTGEKWTFDSAFSCIFGDARFVSAKDAMVFPGKYDSKPSYLLSVMMTKRF